MPSNGPAPPPKPAIPRAGISLLSAPEPAESPAISAWSTDIRELADRPGDLALARVALDIRSTRLVIQVRVFRGDDGQPEAALPRIRVNGLWEPPIRLPRELWELVRAAALAGYESHRATASHRAIGS